MLYMYHIYVYGSKSEFVGQWFSNFLKSERTSNYTNIGGRTTIIVR